MMNIKTRRTIRKYNQQPITDELLNQLLEDSARTQTMGNLQLYSVLPHFISTNRWLHKHP
mgnify:CR=1 FL=1